MANFADDEEKAQSSEETLRDPAPLPEISTRRDSQYDHHRRAISSTVTDHTTLAAWDPGPPPDGGLLAWTQAAMAHLIICNTWGFVNSFGVFQAYYAGAMGHPTSDISWIGSIQICLPLAGGSFSGGALDAGLFRLTLTCGCLIHVFGIFVTSLSTKYWQVFLAQGVCVGVGNGLLFCPAISLVSTYFSKMKSFAMGIAAAGYATGGTIYPVAVQQHLPKIGFGWAVRVLGFITLCTVSLAIAFMRSRLPPRKSRPLLEWGAFKEAPYVLYCIAMFLNFMGLLLCFLLSFGRDITGLSYAKSLNLILIINGIGCIGRIAPNILADRYIGAVNTIIPRALFSGALLFAWSGVRSQSGLIGFSVVYGLFSSGVQSMCAIALSSLTTDLSKAGTRMGMRFSIVSISTLTGPPIAGASIQR